MIDTTEAEILKKVDQLESLIENDCEMNEQSTRASTNDEVPSDIELKPDLS